MYASALLRLRGPHTIETTIRLPSYMKYSGYCGATGPLSRFSFSLNPGFLGHGPTLTPPPPCPNLNPGPDYYSTATRLWRNIPSNLPLKNFASCLIEIASEPWLYLQEHSSSSIYSSSTILNSWKQIWNKYLGPRVAFNIFSGVIAKHCMERCGASREADEQRKSCLYTKILI